MPAPNALPGTTPVGGPEPTLEWVRPGGGVLGALAGRLGSDPSAEDLLVAVMRALHGRLPTDTWNGITEELPFSTRAILRNEAAGAGAWPRGGLVETVADSMLHPRPRAELEVGAVFASLKQALPRGLADAVAAELPPELREIWEAAR